MTSQDQAPGALPQDIMEASLGGLSFSVQAGSPDTRRFWQAAGDGSWEPVAIDCLLRYLNKNTVVVDIGAWIGPVTLMASRLADRVVAVEPDPVAYAQLQANVARNCDNVELHHVAIGESEGHITLYAESLGNSASSAIGGLGSEAHEVATVPLDALMRDVAKDSPLFVKVDIEGFEFAIARQILDLVRERRAIFMFSLHPRNLYRSLRGELGGMAARWQTYRQVRRIMDELCAMGEVEIIDAKTWLPIRLFVLRCIFLRRKLKNFALLLRPRENAA